MADDCAIIEVAGVGVAEQEDEIELSLELSIGGSYRKSEKSNHTLPKLENLSNNEIETDLKGKHQSLALSGASSICVNNGGDVLGPEIGSEFVDPQRKREIHALRRQEARRKREEKLKKAMCRGMNSSAANGGSSFSTGNGFVDHRAWLEAHQFQNRVRERENRENEEVEAVHNKEKNRNIANGEQFVATDNGVAMKDLSLTFSEDGDGDGRNGSNPTVHSASSSIPAWPSQYAYPPIHYVPLSNGFVYPCVTPCWASASGNAGHEKTENINISQPVARRSFRPYHGNQNSGNNLSGGPYLERVHVKGSENRSLMSNGSIERSYSVGSDNQSTSGQGGSSCGTGSHSSGSQQEQQNGTAVGNQAEQSEQTGSLNWIESDHAIDKTASCAVNEISSNLLRLSPTKPIEGHKTDTHIDQVSMPSLTSQDSIPAPMKEAKRVTGKPPKPQNQNHDNPTLPRMPCVSTTGNGPNGKTITGFLYRYTKTEVSIVCVCHGSSFSPAEFVEHAGGVDISNPLKHITIIPSAF